jgi:hypothetical protein
MEYVMKRREQDGIVKLLVCYLQRCHDRNDFEKAFKNHQDEGNLLSWMNFLTK